MSVWREETTNKPRTKRHHCWSWTCKGVIFLPPAPLVQKHHCKLRLTPACCFALPALNFLLLESGNFLVVNESQHNIQTLISICLAFDALCPLRLRSVMTRQPPSFSRSSQSRRSPQNLQPEAVCMQGPGDLYLQRLALWWGEGLSRWLGRIARYLWVWPQDKKLQNIFLGRLLPAALFQPFILLCCCEYRT